MASAKTLGTVLHLHRGTPYVYQGEEIGMTNSYFTDISQYYDLESVNYHAEALTLGLEAAAVMQSLSVKSRDNARTPMQWEDRSHAGFTQGIPWLPANPNYVFVNARAAVNDPGSVFHHYKALIELRHTTPVVVDGRFALLAADHDRLWAFTRSTDDESLLVLANLSTEPLDAADRRAARPNGCHPAPRHPRRRRTGRHPRTLGVTGPPPRLIPTGLTRLWAELSDRVVAATTTRSDNSVSRAPCWCHRPNGAPVSETTTRS